MIAGTLTVEKELALSAPSLQLSKIAKEYMVVEQYSIVSTELPSCLLWLWLSLPERKQSLIVTFVPARIKK